MNMDKLQKSATTNGLPPEPGWENKGAPAPIDPKTGQHKAYWILSEEERAKGFVRPLRFTYKHIGVRPKYPLRPLTPEEHKRYDKFGYVAFEHYPESGSSVTGRYWTQQQLQSGCGYNTRMGLAIAETYARDPEYYGATFCCNCNGHFPVGEDGEFVWVDDPGTGKATEEKVGT